MFNKTIEILIQMNVIYNLNIILRLRKLNICQFFSFFMLTKAIENLNCSNGSSILFWALTLCRAGTLNVASLIVIFTGAYPLTLRALCLAAVLTDGGHIIGLAIFSLFTSVFVLPCSWTLQITCVTGQRTFCWAGCFFINGNACIRLAASVPIGSPGTLHVSFWTMNWTHRTAFGVPWHACIRPFASVGINWSGAHIFIISAMFWAICWAFWVLCDTGIRCLASSVMIHVTWAHHFVLITINWTAC